MSYKYYQASRQTVPPSGQNLYRYHLQQIVNAEFENASDIYYIKRYDRITKAWEDITIRSTMPYEITKLSNMRDDYRKFIFKDLSKAIYLGDTFDFNGHRWMAVDLGRIESPTSSAIVQRCNIQLNFTTATPLTSNIITLDAIAQNILLDTKTDVFIPLPAGEINVYVPVCDDARKIKFAPKPTRFLLGLSGNSINNIHNYVVQNIDYISHVRQLTGEEADTDVNGFIAIRLKQSQSNSSKDNLSLRVAWQDYF